MSSTSKRKGMRRGIKIVAVVAAAIIVALLAVRFATHRDPLVTLPEERPRSVLIRNVRVIDVVQGTARDAMDVFLRGSLIASIVPHPSKEQADAVIDGGGMSVVPGLIDIHCHLIGPSAPPWKAGLPDPEANLERLLYAGVTRVLDPASFASEIFPLRDGVKDGSRLGPVIHAAGPMFTAPGGHPIPMIDKTAPWFLKGMLIDDFARQVGSREQAAEAIAGLAPLEPDVIKIAIDSLPPGAPRLDPGVAAAVVDEARKRGLRTVAHIGTVADALDAGRAGVAAFMHGVYKERIADEAIGKLAAFEIPMAPTLIVFETFARLGRGKFEATELERQIAPTSVLDARIQAPDDWHWGDTFEPLLEQIREQRQDALDNVRRLSAAGVVMLAGSDAQGGVIHGASFHAELELLAEAGLSPLDVLRAATLNNARFLADSADPPYGVVAAGKRADLLVVRGDPLTEVSAITRIEHVIAGGVPIERHPIAH